MFNKQGGADPFLAHRLPERHCKGPRLQGFLNASRDPQKLSGEERREDDREGMDPRIREAAGINNAMGSDEMADLCHHSQLMLPRVCRSGGWRSRSANVIRGFAMIVLLR
jgi:hypothetical protein